MKRRFVSAGSLNHTGPGGLKFVSPAPTTAAGVSASASGAGGGAGARSGAAAAAAAAASPTFTPSSGTLPLPSTHVRTLRGHKGPVLRVRYNSDCNYCMTAGNDKTIRLWNPNRDSDGAGSGVAREVKLYQGPHGYPVNDICISHDNSRFASAGGDRICFMWDVTTGRTLRKFHGHIQRLNCVAFNKESTVLVSGSYDGTARAWDCRAHTRTPIQVLKNFKDSVMSVLCTSSEIIAGSVDGCVRIFDLRAGRLRVDTVHDPVSHVTLSNDGKCLLVSCLSSQQARLLLLEKDAGTLLNEYTGHTNSAYPIDCAFSYSDAHVMCGSEKNDIHFWDLVEGKEVHRLRGHSRAVCSVAYHKDNHTMLSASYDGTVRVWNQ